jgi:hypothetical protein
MLQIVQVLLNSKLKTPSGKAYSVQNSKLPTPNSPLLYHEI